MNKAKVIQKSFFSENILIESLFWLQCNQDEYFIYFIEDFIDDVIYETKIVELAAIYEKPEIITDELVKVFHAHEKYGFLCRVGFPTYHTYNPNNIGEYSQEYHLKVIYSETLQDLEQKINVYSNEFKKLDMSLKTKEDEVREKRNLIKLVKG